MTFKFLLPGAAIFGFILSGPLLNGPSAFAARRDSSGVPNFDVATSCRDAAKFGVQGSNKDIGYKGCIQDEDSAKRELRTRWGSFKNEYRQNCVEQARAPNPSYVEVLTCLEMFSDGMTGGAKPAPGRVKAGDPLHGDDAQPGISK